MRQDATSRGDHSDTGRWLRFWVAAAALAAAMAGAVLMATTSDAEKSSAGTIDSADLSLTKSDSPDPVQEDTVLTYTIRVRKAGPDAATNIAVSDDLPSQVDPLSADASPGNCAVQRKKVSCELDDDSGVQPRSQSGCVRGTRVDHEHRLGGKRRDRPAGPNNGSRDHKGEEPPEAATCKNKAVTFLGTDVSETLSGTSGKDVIFGGGGNDGIDAAGGKDLICAGDGNDLILAGGGKDVVKAQAGSDGVKARPVGTSCVGAVTVTPP